MPKILIAEDDAAFGQMLHKFLSRKSFDITLHSNAQEAIAAMQSESFDLVLTDLRLPDADGLHLLDKTQQLLTGVPVVVMTGYAEVQTAVRAMKQGAVDYIAKPFTPDELLRVLSDALAIQEKTQKTQNKSAPKESPEPHTPSGHTALKAQTSEASRQLDQYIELVAPTPMSVLIIGESGTGKEVTAKRIHDQSPRAQHAFVAVDCGAIPKDIATSAFFGHVKGSFTGALEDKPGHFEAAHKGTLFLDEVGNLSYENQVQLLRVLQERKVKRVGSNTEIPVDVRIIAATNEDLKQAVDQGSFREDLYHRLNEFGVQVPPLRDRLADLEQFAQFFLDKANATLGKEVKGFDQAVLQAFKRYTWPGNIRELQNVIKRSVLLTQGSAVPLSVLPREIIQQEKHVANATLSKASYEKDRILRALEATNYNKTKAAELLEVTRKTLYNKINQYNLEV